MTLKDAVTAWVSKKETWQALYSLDEPVDVNNHLTDDHEDKDDAGHSCADVEHDSDVVRQLIHIVHIWHKDGWDQEPNGNTHLWVRGTKLNKWLCASSWRPHKQIQSVHFI